MKYMPHKMLVDVVRRLVRRKGWWRIMMSGLIGLLGLLAASNAGAGHLARWQDDIQAFLPIVSRVWDPGDGPGGGMLLISEVLYDPDGTEPGEEWIEIFNPGSGQVELSLFKLGDEETQGGGEGMMVFPPSARIDSQQALVVANRAVDFSARYGFPPDFEMRETDPTVPTMVRHAAWATGSVVLLNTSDEVILLDGDDQLVDALSWGTSTFAFNPPAPDVDAGHSLERVPANGDTDTSADWVEQAVPNPGGVDLSTPTPVPSPTLQDTPSPTPTPGPTGESSPTPTQSPPAGDTPVLISEVLYDPEGTEPGEEWIELYNWGPASLALDGYKVGDEEESGGGEGMYRFPDGMMINVGQAIVVAREGSAFSAVYGFDPDFEFSDTDPDVPDMINDTGWAGGSVSLGNTGDEVLLLDGGDRLVDALSWGSSTFAFDPSAPDVMEGHSLARQPADRDTDTALDWVDAAVPDPGSVSLQPPTATPDPSQTATPTPQIATETPSLTPTVTPQAPPTETPSPSETPTSPPDPSNTPTVTPALTLTVTPTPNDGLYLLISEVYYDAVGSDPAEEWIEIYNPTGSVVDLSVYRIGDEETAGGSEGMYGFPEGSEIQPEERLVVALNAAGFRALYGTDPAFEVSDSDPNVPDMIPSTSWGSGAIAMSNGGDEILLLDEQGMAVDVVVYESGVYPGVIPHPGVATDHSLERSPVSQDTDDCSLDFLDQPAPSPGS